MRKVYDISISSYTVNETYFYSIQIIFTDFDSFEITLWKKMTTKELISSLIKSASVLINE